MSQRTTIIIATIAAIVGIVGIALSLCAYTRLHQEDQKTQTALTVTLGPSVSYASKHGNQFKARYGSLSDDSLNFVKIQMPDGRELTLPQVLSGSGVRYTDEREIVWWEHHGVIRLDVRDEKGGWKTGYKELKKVE